MRREAKALYATLKRVHLQPWMELVGTLNDVVEDSDTVLLRIDDRLLSLPAKANASKNITRKKFLFMGKSMSILRTDIPEYPYLIRLVSR